MRAQGNGVYTKQRSSMVPTCPSRNNRETRRFVRYFARYNIDTRTRLLASTYGVYTYRGAWYGGFGEYDAVYPDM